MEIWRDVKGFEGMYEVSNYGRVRSLDRVTVMKNGRKRKTKGQMRKTWADKDGYLLVSLSKRDVGECHRVHRLVAKAFLLQQDGKLFVNHMDGDKANNRLENLEWCTRSENMQHAHDNKLLKQARGERNHSKLTQHEASLIKYCPVLRLVNNVQVGRDFGVSTETVRRIRCGMKWSWL